MARIVVPPLSIGTGAAPVAVAEATTAPVVQSLALSFGVGSGREGIPSDDDFRITYQLTIPIFSLGGLDPDGVYEFDAAGLLSSLVERAKRRHWGVRLELSLEQAADSAGRAGVIVEAPDGVSALHVVGNPSGDSLPGGARHLQVATSVVTDPSKVASTLDGAYRIAVELGGAEHGERIVRVALSRYEFQD